MAVKDKAASTLTRLYNAAAGLKISYQQALLLFAQEEFLRRLEASPYSENLVLKGGLFLYLITSRAARTTLDADFLLRNCDNSEDSIHRMLEVLLATRTCNDFVSFGIEKVERIAIHQNYHGVRATLSARIKKTRTPLLIDIGVGDIVKPSTPRRYFVPMLSDQPATSVLTYSLESTIAEKLDVIIRWQAFSTRMKDFFDIYYLCTNYEFDGSTLYDAIRETLTYRRTSLDSSTLDNLDALTIQPAMRMKWDTFLSKLEFPPIPFEDIMRTLLSFLRPVAVSIMQDATFIEHWAPRIGWYHTTEVPPRSSPSHRHLENG